MRHPAPRQLFTPDPGDLTVPNYPRPVAGRLAWSQDDSDEFAQGGGPPIPSFVAARLPPSHARVSEV